MARASGELRAEAPPQGPLLFLGLLAAAATLYFARDVFIPLALALLFSFILTPLIARLERLGLGRVPSLLIVLVTAFCALVGGGWLVTMQLSEMAGELPAWRVKIHDKIERAHATAKPGELNKISGNVQQIAEDLSKLPATGNPPKPAQPAVPVQMVDKPRTMSGYVREVLGPLLKPLETVVIVLIFTIFMTIERESLRNRLLRLMGQAQFSLTTKALSDAAQRVSRYLLAQFLVNSGLGLAFGLGLWLIGVPHPFLFGAMAAALRFIPYVGILAAASMPILLSFVVFDGWTRPLLTLGFFLVLEVSVANLVEPLLYGAHTGISSLAILVAAIFWASLWGPVGLILSTPLTVCLVVIGKHVPQLAFLDIVLGDEPVLLPAERFYQRLLALDANEARVILEQTLGQKPLVEVYDEVVLPALAMAEQDRYRSELREATLEFICQTTAQLVEELTGTETGESPEYRAVDRRFLCFGATDEADEVAAAMLAQTLGRARLVAVPFPVETAPVSVLEQFSYTKGDVVCVCALPPLALMHARSAVKRLRQKYPDVAVLVCLFGLPEDQVERVERLAAGKVVRTLAGALTECERMTGTAEHEEQMAGAAGG